MSRLIFILLLLLPSFIFAQTKIGGVVTDDKSKAIDGAIISILNPEQEILGYELSDKKGTFSISVDSSIDKLTVVVSLLGYESKEIVVDNKDQSLNIKLLTKSIELKEVIFKSDLIWRKEDTLVYSVNSFKNQQDRTIGDVLKKLPGVEVSTGGQIKYNGENINKFYIEGLDLLESRYGIATNNVPADAVQNVEILENHQPVNSLKNIFDSGQAAINLKLKNNKLSRPVGSVEVGGGANEDDLQWLLNAFALLAAPKSQTIAMYKTNNIGANISNELTQFSVSMSDLSQSNQIDKKIFNENPFREMDLDYKRYLFNKSHTVSINHLMKTKKDAQLRANINYLHDTRDEEVFQSSSYFLQDSVLNINELSLIDKTSNQLSAALTYTDNSDKFFLNNKLSTNLKWNKIFSDVTSNDKIIQHYPIPEYKLSNELQFVKKMSNRVWNISSQIHYSSLPQRLEVDIDSVSDGLNQSIHYTGLYSKTSSSLSFIKGYSVLAVNFAVETQNEGLNSELNHPILKDSTRNKLNTDLYLFYINPVYTYQKNRLKLTLNTEIKQHLMKVKNKEYDTKRSLSYLYVLPRVSISYKLNPYLDAITTYRYNKSIGDIFDFTTSPMMYNYRNINLKSGVLAKRTAHSASFRLNYRNPLKALFANSSISYINSEKNLLNQQRFVGIQSVSGNIKKDNKITSWLWNGYLGKYIAPIRTNLSLYASFNLTESEKLQQDVLYPIRSNNWNVFSNIIVKITDNMNLTYQLKFNHNKLLIENDNIQSKSINNQISQSLNYYYFIKKWEFNIRGEYLYSRLAKDLSNDIFFADLHVKYATKKFDIGFQWNNIFNKKEFKYIRYSDLDIYTYNFKLRPSSVMCTFAFKY